MPTCKEDWKCIILVSFWVLSHKILFLRELMNVEVGLEGTENILCIFIIRNVFRVVKIEWRAGNGCSPVDFSDRLGDALLSLLLFKPGKQRSPALSCQRSVPSPDLAQLWWDRHLWRSWVMAVCTEPHTRPFIPQILVGCHCLPDNGGRSWARPTSVFMGLTCWLEEEGGENTGKWASAGERASLWRTCGRMFWAEGTGNANSWRWMWSRVF